MLIILALFALPAAGAQGQSSAGIRVPVVSLIRWG